MRVIANERAKFMKHGTLAILMALGLMSPAVSFAQDERGPRRDDPPGPREERNEGRREARPGRQEREERPEARSDRGIPSREGRPGDRGGAPAPLPPLPPLFAALDANHDGVIDEKEMDNAGAALRKLD